MSMTKSDRKSYPWTARLEHEAAFWHPLNLGNRATLVIIGIVLGIGLGGVFWGMQ